ncbi:hypothetical protein C1G86_0913 [Dehalococcoides mccartyi]|uniref:Uncharacterized protein n=2 Tax=Dehalococcoides mccartyi TaxID=61435 RepID=A0A142VA72_9CHLR|nr:hypothetical protein Dm11a5_0908 [Dehalococcoides mccartyi]CAI83091.1 hypothetical protein cbdbB21 [Dehalococcoides mccartyi CBDB1]AOV99502.1 hypothetical protein DCWBC2_0870 [Dehalococcoides mccartyi]MBA2085302.1 hypothetical protein [Dehalococcoides mccartyi]RAL69779.1 hypothetical protein C1G87_0887 [Dehalococcoides mccartyi]
MRILAYKNIIKLQYRNVKYVFGINAAENCLKSGQVICF